MAVRPVAERAAIMLLRKEVRQGNAVLYVQFPAGSGAARVIRLHGERQPATLRDDGVAPDSKAGDGTHSAYIRVDPQRLARQQKRFLEMGSVPLFAGRELVGRMTATLTDRRIALKDIPPMPDPETLRRAKRVKQSLVLPFEFNVVEPDSVIPILPGVEYQDVIAPSSLMITDPGVIGDPARTYNRCSDLSGINGNIGKWTFGHLMEEMAKGSGVSKEEFVKQWLAKWSAVQLVNGFPVPPRPVVPANLITIWQPLLANGDLDLSISPFRLVAIVNRLDLGDNLAYGDGIGTEARFSFAADCNLAIPSPPFLVIFEYAIPLHGCAAIKAWAQQWQDLGALPIGSPQYNDALEAITVQFTEYDRGSKLSQLRTNEAFVGVPWELREFRLSVNDGLLEQVTVKQTPDDGFDFTPELAAYALANESGILGQLYTVPDTLSGSPFLGGNSLTRGIDVGLSDGGTFWDGPDPVAMPPRDPAFVDAVPSSSITTRGLRHQFSLNTCNGCHGGETKTPFAHVDGASTLSGFLTGIDVDDPAGESFTITLGEVTSVIPIKRSFNDLLRRQLRMAEILGRPCEGDLMVAPLTIEH